MPRRTSLLGIIVGGVALAFGASCGPDRSDSPASLALALKSRDVAVRRSAASRLEELGSEAATAVGALSDALRDEDYSVRKAAARALGAIGPLAADAVDELVVALADKNSAVRGSSAWALGEIHGKPQESLDALLKALRGGRVEPHVVLTAMSKFGMAPSEVVPILIDLIDEHGGLAIQAIGKIGPVAKEAVPALIAVLRNISAPRESRELAAWSLGRIGREAKEAIPVLETGAGAGLGNASEALKAIRGDG